MSLIIRWRDYFAGLRGWRRQSAAFVCGGLAVLALPPFHLVPVLVPAFVGFSWLIDGARPALPAMPMRTRFLAWHVGGGAWRDAYRVGWWFGVGFFLFGLYWITSALLVDAARFAWLIPFVLIGIVGLFAVYSGLAALATFAISSEGPGRIASLALWWVVFEWLRGWLFTGFPWNLVGTVWTFSDAMIQLAAVTGVFGLSLVTVMAAVAPAVFGLASVTGFQRWWSAGVPFAVLTLIWIGGQARLADASDASVEGVALRLVQPNIAQSDKWVRNLRDRHLQNLLDLSRYSVGGQLRGAAPTHVIWPETAVPFLVSDKSPSARAISAAVPAGGALLTGAQRFTARVAGGPFLWNSLHVLTQDATISANYDKHHLVPFGEYVPFKSLLPVTKFTAGRIDFSPGPGVVTLSVPGAPRVGPLICFEALFPGRVVAEAVERPGWLLNVTNDAWFGNSPGPYQHFAAVRLRATEEGIPLVRVANTGISAVVDAYGRVRVQTSLGERIAVNSALPKRLSDKTSFARVGNPINIIIGLVYLIVLLGIPTLLSKLHLRK